MPTTVDLCVTQKSNSFWLVDRSEQQPSERGGEITGVMRHASRVGSVSKKHSKQDRSIKGKIQAWAAVGVTHSLDRSEAAVNGEHARMIKVFS